MDEVALKKGHRDFVVLVTTRDAEGQLKLLGVLPDRKIETIEKFLSAIPERLRATVRAVRIDMYEGYASAVKKVLPQARVVAGRFHVAKKYRDCADKLRIEVQRDLKACLNKEENERFCRRLQQQGQSPQTALLWDHKSDASVSTAFSRPRRLSPLWAMKHKIWGAPREFRKSQRF